MELITDIKGINKAIGQIKSSGKKLDDKIQHVALSVIAHNEQHHNVTVVNDLFNAMPNGSRRSALQAWLLKYGGVAINTNKETAATGKHFNDSKDKHADIEGGSAEPWYSMKPEPTPIQSLNVYSKVASLMKAITKAREAGADVTVSDEDMEVLAKLAAKAVK